MCIDNYEFPSLNIQVPRRIFLLCTQGPGPQCLLKDWDLNSCLIVFQTSLKDGTRWNCHLVYWQMLCKYQASFEVQLMEPQALWMGRGHMAICSDSLPDAQSPDFLSGMMMRQATLLTVG